MAVNNAAAAAAPALPGLTLRVDNGTQYTSRDFRSSMAALGIELEYVYVNTPEQNGHIESFHKTLKKEYVWPREFADLREARQAMLGAFDDYNNNRIHSSLEYLTPSEFAEAWGRQEAERLENKRIIGGGRCE
ncbi:MAG: transposase [Nitrosopumilaceae archaeon]|nr:transposase [Nitrosopumilaceae archaeon]